MDIPIIPPIAISVAIKKKKKHNVQKKKEQIQELNKFNFKIPCKNHNNKRVQCVSFTIDDLAHFRSRFLRTPDVYSQDLFISEFLKISAPQRRRPRNVYADNNKSRNFHVDYTIETIDGKRWGVCKAMFIETLGIKRKRLSIISQHLYEKQQNQPRTEEKPKRKYRKTLEREKLLQKKQEEVQEELVMMMEVPPITKEMQTEIITVLGTQNVEEKIVEECGVNFANLCRICSQTGEFISLFETSILDENYAQKLEYSLGIKIEQSEKLPDNICKKCVDRIEIACSLKKDCLESMRIMNDSLESAKTVISSQDFSGEEDFEILHEFEATISQDEMDDFIIEEILDTPITTSSPEKSAKITNKITSSSTKTMRPTKCFICDVDFDSSPESHFEKFHKEIRQMSCHMCEFETHYPWYLNLHYQVHADAYKLCENCGKVVKTTSFFSHYGHCTRNKDGMKKFSCNFCSNRYHKSYLLKVHERIHTHEKPYKCEIETCGVAFSKRFLLRKHMLDHGVIPEFSCDLCGKGFIVKNRLLAHQSSCIKHKSFLN